MLRLTALKGQHVDLSERKQGNWDRAQGLRFRVKPADFLVARGNGSLSLVARGAYVPDDADEVAFPDTMIRIRPDPGKLFTPYLYYLWGCAATRRQLEAAAKTTAGIYKVSQGDLNAIELVIPPVDEQHVIVKRLDEAFSMLDRVAGQHARATALLDRLDQATLARAFRGALVPQEAP